MKVASLFFTASLLLSTRVVLAANKTANDGLRGSAAERNLQALTPVERFDPSKVRVLVKYKTSQGKQDAINKASKVEYESSRFKLVSIEIDETDMLALQNDPEIEFVDLNLERSLFPPVKDGDFYIVNQYADRDGEKPPKKKEKPVKDRRRLAETMPYGIVSVQADPNNEGVAPGPFANDITVCVVDTGYDLGHEDLPNGDRVTGSDGYGQDWDDDGNSHGTHCAGTIAAIGNNGLGVVGVIPNAHNSSGIKLHIGKGLDNSGSGSSSGVLLAVENCVNNGAKIISMSLGGGGSSSSEESAYHDAYIDDNVLIIAAAGNDGSSGLSYPASYESVMSVAAVDSDDNRASFSQYNDQVEISGPGVNVESTVPGSNYDDYSGTSMATPHVAGVAALVWSYNTTCSAQQIRRILLASAMSLGQGDCNEFYGRGLVQAKAAVEMLQEFGCDAANSYSLLDSDGLNSEGSCYGYEALVPTAPPVLTPAPTPPPSPPTPAPTPTPPPAPLSCSPTQEVVKVDLVTDRFCQETSWTLRNSAGDIEMSSPAYIQDVDDETQFISEKCLEMGASYVFNISDKYGDGMCCNYGDGSYKVMCGNEMMAEGGEFLYNETTAFSVPDPIDDTPSASPSSLPSLEPSSSPSGSPTTMSPSAMPSSLPSLQPSVQPSSKPSSMPSASPSSHPSSEPSESLSPSSKPSGVPSTMPSDDPSSLPSKSPSVMPSAHPTSDVHVTGLVLVDAVSNEDIPGAFDCAPYLCEHDAALLDIRAATSDGVQSVRLGISGPVNQAPRVENAPPYSLLGDVSGSYTGAVFRPGTYYMTAEPFSLPDAGGEAGPMMTMEFVIAAASEEPSSTPSSQPSSNPSKEPSSTPSMMPSGVPSASPSMNPTRVPTEQEIVTSVWTTITYDDFNENWGNFGDGGSDAHRVTDSWKTSISSYIPEGSASLRIRDNSGDASSVFLKEGRDVSGFTNLRVSFSFKSRKMENGEDFFLEYSSDGQTYSPVKSWVILQGSEYVNNVYYYETVDFDAVLGTDGYSLMTSNAKIRFVCDASGNGDQIFIDEVSFEGYGRPPS